MTQFALYGAQIGHSIDQFLRNHYAWAPRRPVEVAGQSFLYTFIGVSVFAGVVAGVTVGAYSALASLVYTAVTPFFDAITADKYPSKEMNVYMHSCRVMLSNAVACAVLATKATLPIYAMAATITHIYQTLVNDFNEVPLRKAPFFIGPAHITIF